MKTVFTSFILLATLRSFAVLGTEEKPVKSIVEEVTVYLSGAEIHRSGNTTLNPGTSYLVFENLSPYIDKNSIQVTGKGKFTILSVVHRINYLNEKEKPLEIKVLEDSLESLNMKLNFQTGLEGVYKNEESMILSNQSIGNKDVGVDAVDLEEVANFFRRRLTDIQQKRMDAQALKKKLSEDIVKINKQLQEMNSIRNKSTGEIVVGVSVKEKTPAIFNINYFVGNAGWAPFYDLRAEDVKNPVELNYRAKVFQSTGVNWDNVKITLSTLNPTRSGTKPVMYPWTLQLSLPAPVYRDAMQTKAAYGQKAAMPQAMAMEVQEMDKAETTADFTTVSQNQLSAEFKIGIPYTIPSDGQKHDVTIGNHSLPVTFIHFSVPKLDKDAFLLAKVTGWEDYKILSGEANIYFGGTYVGKSFINTKTTNDTLDFSFGRDNSVVITREKIKDFTNKKWIGTNKKETFAFEISVRNTNQNPVEITIEDQVPISPGKEIEVELDESSSAEYNAESGKLLWTMPLRSGETKKVRLIYSVKYPKDKIIYNF